MSRKSQLPPDIVEQAFVTLKSLQGLRHSTGEPPVLFAEVMHYLQGSGSADKARVEQALGRDIQLRRLFNKMLEEQRLAYVPKEARADDGSTVMHRLSRGFTLAFRASKADASQIYVILQVLPESGVADGRPVSLIAIVGDTVKRVSFPALQDQGTQTILLSGDDALVMLKSSDSELSLVSP